MALTLNQFVGFETGGLEESIALEGTPDPTESVIVRSGARSLHVESSESYSFNIFDEVANAGNNHIVGWATYFTAYPTSRASGILLRVSTGSPQTIFEIYMDTDGTVELEDQANTTVVDGSIVLELNRWHYFEVYWEVAGSNAVGELFINDVSVGSTTTADFLGSSGTLERVQLMGSGFSGGCYHDDCYWLSGATAASDRLGPGVSVLPYGPGKQSATPDYDENGNSVVANDDLDVGQWDDASLVPWAETAEVQEYTIASAVGGAVACNDSAGSAGPGPSGGNKIVSGIIVGAKWGFRADRSAGGATTHSIVYGSDDSGTFTAGTGSPKSVTLNSGNATNHFVLLAPADAGVPTASETFAIGIANDGGRDFELISYQCFLLHVSSTTVTDLSDGKMPEYPSHGLTVEV